MKYKKDIHNYVQAHSREIIQTLKRLAEIPSVRGEAEENAPFGKECARMLEAIESLYKENGLKTEIDQKGGYLLSYCGEGEKTLGLFAHADVVPAGDDWLLTDPFKPLEKDGYLIGRGVLDDKSAVVISLYCAKLLKELNIPFNSKLVMFTGVNEESGMADIKKYVSKHTPPDFSLVADTAFPLYRGDKGILHFVASSLNTLSEVDGFSGGSAFNIILGEASAKYKNKLFTEKGVSKHGALPEGSVNAGYLLAKRLLEEDLCGEDEKQLRFAKETLENYYGEAFGIECDADVFGRLTCTNGIIETIDKRLSLSFDMRYGMSVNIESAKKKITNYFAENGWQVEFVKEQKPFCRSEDDPYVLACLKTYKAFTGTEDATAHINAGGTYASRLPSAVEIGTALYGGRPKELPQGTAPSISPTNV